MNLDGYKIKILRVIHGMDQQEFSEKVGCTQSLLSKVERGSCRVSRKLNAKIISYFNVDESKLTALDAAIEKIAVNNK